ncbi:MAG: hypothetical protein A3E78_17280 [Alphaproteobacteria bacterium RIFCSPHIGHO2_12_FULL_63_12]|nr:MAG: hypothetical protein A3E78_17280 [Alphaproteobacteria bacterium RIFCSPHIGHO2_12_FULL_63_12]
MIKDTMMPGPAYSAAARPVRTKIPVPMMQPMPRRMRFQAPSVRFSSPPSNSACICSIDFRRINPLAKAGRVSIFGADVSFVILFPPARRGECELQTDAGDQ